MHHPVRLPQHRADHDVDLVPLDQRLHVLDQLADRSVTSAQTVDDL